MRGREKGERKEWRERVSVCEREREKRVERERERERERDREAERIEFSVSDFTLHKPTCISSPCIEWPVTYTK